MADISSAAAAAREQSRSAAGQFGVQSRTAPTDLGTSDGPLVHRAMGTSNCRLIDLANQVANGDLDLDAPYQRGHVWDVGRQRNLFRSGLQGIPIPAVIINDRSGWPELQNRVDLPWDSCIDGKQRITAMKAWVDGELALPATWFESRMLDCPASTPNVTVNDLSLTGRRYIESRMMIGVARSNVPTVEEEAEIYLLVNASGVEQSDTDLERAAKVARP